ncbi:hypothetical protein [Kitasatospora sp. NPDC059327]|uniref:hypothetical protein n=1 Tax=Kitasatospora sp. NPDC059327 TaxID=3346803 RepID=UPI00369DF9C4
MISAESLGHRVEEVRVDLGAGWEDVVLADAPLRSTNPVTWIDGFAAAFERPVDAGTVEPETPAAYRWATAVQAPSAGGCSLAR